MDMKTIARIGALAFAAVAITVTAIEMRAGAPAPVDPIAAAPRPGADPLRDEMLRCQLIGQAAASDPACLRAWAENRRRFLAPGARPEASKPDRIAAATAASHVAQSASGSDASAIPGPEEPEEH
jgi:conjugative transfer region protein TrbK